MVKRISKDKRLLMAKNMPPLRKKIQGCEYDCSTDEVNKWIANQPELMDYIFCELSKNKCIVYNPDTGTWQGANYGCTGDSAEFE